MLAIALALMSVAVACSSTSKTKVQGAAASKPADMTYLTEYLPDGLHVPLVYAQDEGLYKKEGINLHISYGVGSPVTAASVGGGKVDFGDVDGGVAATSIASGNPIVVVGMFTDTTEFGFFVPKNSSFNRIADIAGQNVILTPGAEQTLLPGVLKSAGLSMSSIRTQVIQGPAAVTAYEQGQADVLDYAIADEEAAVQAKRPSRIIPYTANGFIVPGFAFVVRRSLIDSDPDVVARFLRATYNGITEAYAHEDKAVADFARANPTIPASLIRDQFRGYKQFLCSDAMTKSHAKLGDPQDGEWKAGLNSLVQYAELNPATDVTKVETGKFFQAPYSVSSSTCPLP